MFGIASTMETRGAVAATATRARHVLTASYTRVIFIHIREYVQRGLIQSTGRILSLPL